MYLLLHAFTTWADTFQHPMCCPHCPQLSTSPLLTPTPPAGSPGRNTLLPNVSLQSFQPECYRETLETRLRAEIIANIELCLIKNINFTMFPFSPQKIYIFTAPPAYHQKLLMETHEFLAQEFSFPFECNQHLEKNAAKASWVSSPRPGISREPPQEVPTVNYAGHWNRLLRGSSRGSTGTSGYANAHFGAYISYSHGKLEQMRGKKPLVCKSFCCGVKDFIEPGQSSSLKTTPSTSLK